MLLKDCVIDHSEQLLISSFDLAKYCRTTTNPKQTFVLQIIPMVDFDDRAVEL